MASSMNLLLASALLLGLATFAESYSMDDVDVGDDEDPVLETGAVSMLQVGYQLTAGSAEPAATAQTAPPSGRRDLAMAYLPYNFGHTVAKAALASDIKWGDCGSRTGRADTCMGHGTSTVTGCELMYTPGKYWPKDAAKAYFGNMTVFGILRDPYERMVSQFRGSGRFTYPDLFAKCDVNAGVKSMMREYLANVKVPAHGLCDDRGDEHVGRDQGDPLGRSSPQLHSATPGLAAHRLREEPGQRHVGHRPNGATVFVDNRQFPHSMNSVLLAHGYKEIQIAPEEVAHVTGCDHVWAGDLDSEAKALVRQVYARDFQLLCSHFGYCDTLENTCITRVPGMCPPQLFKWDSAQQMFTRK
mmetsp:Transcript_61130/g.189377  ORF Transcript_61130/g.189377 Transcript_61130/m.189377 type:complete len:358 (+) Transcript_61130:80-1153(+)